MVAPSRSGNDSGPVQPLFLGMRRVRWVRLWLGEGEVRAEVVGTSHRNPIVRSVPMSWANRLIKAGCPYVVRREPPASSGAEA